MYEFQNQSNHENQKKPLTVVDYHLMMDASGYIKYDSNMIEYNHPECQASIQSHSLHLEPSMTKKQFNEDEYEYGSDSNNSSNGSVYFKDLSYQTSCFNTLFSTPDVTTYLVPAPSSMVTDANYSSETNKNNINQVPAPSSQHLFNQQYIECSANPYSVYQQNIGTTSDPLMCPSLEGYVTMSSFHDYVHENENNKNLDATWYGQYLEQYYGGSLDGQEQQQRKKQWFQHQQPQELGYTHTQHNFKSSSLYYCSANTNENNDSRSQIYVRKACVSCKQSHVACDVQRPCSRCVRLNKAETCVDAQRKKRGRPCGSGKKKKVEENEFRRQYQQYF